MTLVFSISKLLTYKNRFWKKIIRKMSVWFHWYSAQSHWIIWNLFFKICFCTLHRGAFCQFPFRWVYYCHSSKSTGKETGKTHLCALLICWWIPIIESRDVVILISDNYLGKRTRFKRWQLWNVPRKLDHSHQIWNLAENVRDKKKGSITISK